MENQFPLPKTPFKNPEEEISHLQKLIAEKENAGFNALTEKFSEDLIKEGIIDPVKVTRTALQNASSAAAILLTTEAAIADEPEPKKSHNPGPEMGGGMDY